MACTQSSSQDESQPGTQVFFLSTQPVITFPHRCAFCRKLTLSQLFSNPKAPGKKKISCADFTSHIANLKTWLKKNTQCFLIVGLCHRLLYVILSFSSPFPKSGTIEVARHLSLTRFSAPVNKMEYSPILCSLLVLRRASIKEYQ